MKPKLIKLLAIFLLMSYSGCVELDLVNPNAMSEESFWKTEEDLYQGVIAAYDALQLDGLYGGNLPVVFTGLSDDGTGESTNEYFAPFRFKSAIYFSSHPTAAFSFSSSFPTNMVTLFSLRAAR